MKLVISIILLINECLSDDLLNETFLYKSYGKLYKKYIIDNENEMLFSEIILRYDGNNITSHYSINTYWFFNLTKTEIVNLGYFFGLGQTRKEKNGTISDFKLCKYVSPTVKCEDYSFNGNLDNIETDILENFKPILDSVNNGTDDIYSYSFGDVITNGIENFNSLIECKMTLPIFKADIYDLELNSSDNLTFVVGSLNNIESYKRFSGFKVLKVATQKIDQFIVNYGNYFKTQLLVYVLLILYF
jgi:hypothetical protein